MYIHCVLNIYVNIYERNTKIYQKTHNVMFLQGTQQSYS